MKVSYQVTYSPRGPGHFTTFIHTFDHNPSPREIADAFGITEGAHLERILDGSFTVTDA